MHMPEVFAMPDFPRSILAFQRQFSDEAACASWLSAARWPEGLSLPGLRGHDRAWELAAKAWTYECAQCRRQTSVTAGTVMHGSKLPLTVWFWAAYLMATHSNGLSARQMWRQLGLAAPTRVPRLLCAKLRRAMVNPARALLSGVVEIDETQVSYRTKDDPATGGGGGSPDGKMQVAVAVEIIDEAPGRLRLGTIEDASSASLHPFIKANVAAGSTLKTDGWSAYPGVAGFKHEPHVVGAMAARACRPALGASRDLEPQDVGAGRLPRPPPPASPVLPR